MNTKVMVAVALVVGLFVAGCTTVQSRTTGVAQLNNVDLDEAFAAATNAAVTAGLTIVGVEKDAGLINATRGANSLLTYQNPLINIFVQKVGDGAQIRIASTVGGQLLDYGTTKKTIEDFCAALKSAPSVTSCDVM
jgi:hypothetical protein